MNVTLPQKEKGRKKRIITYIVILVICVIAIGIAIYQFYADEKLGVIVGVTQTEDEETEKLKSEFNNMFNNRLITNQNITEVAKIKQDEDLVYATYVRQERENNSYDLNINVPSININNNNAKKYNEDIKKHFQIPAEEILQTKNRNIAYTVNYTSYLENDVLSLVILSTYKEGSQAQRTIVKTYNYDIKENKEIILDDFIKIKNVDKNTIEEKIKNEVEKSQKQTEELRELGYNIFSRNISDNMYKIENTTEFFMYNSNVYLIYAYGNKNNTSEMDIVIF